jgi:hypothetical protein
MTQCQPDIKSFLKTDLKSEQKKSYVDRHYVVLRTDINSEKKTQRRRLICQTDINSQNRKQRQADTKSFLKDRCQVRKNDTPSGQHKFIFKRPM